ncbi:hypothetical protein ANN_02448, partial [Periplaneta americana]
MKVIVDRNHFDEIIECIILLIAYIVFIPKYCTILMKSTEIRNLVYLVPENFFIHTDHLTTENKSIIMSTLKYAKCLTLFYTSLLTTCFIFNIDIVPFVLNYKAIRESSNTTSEALRVLQFNIWLPYDYFPSPAFQLTYFFLTIKYHIVGFSILSADILILNLLIYASGQFELLWYALKNFEENVIYRVRKKNSIGNEEDVDILTLEHKTDIVRDGKSSYLHNKTGHGNLMPNKIKLSQIKEDETSWDGFDYFSSDICDNYRQLKNLSPGPHLFQREAEYYLTECIQHHQNLIDNTEFAQKYRVFCKRTDLLWSTTFFVKFATASLWLCFLGYQALVVINCNEKFAFIYYTDRHHLHEDAAVFGMRSMPSSPVLDFRNKHYDAGKNCSAAGYRSRNLWLNAPALYQLSYLRTTPDTVLGSSVDTVLSEAVYNAVYESEWYTQSERFKQCTRMIIMRAQKPVRITAGRFGTLSLPLFAS